VNLVDVSAGFSAVEGAVEGAPNANVLLAAVEGVAVAVFFGRLKKSKGVDDLGGSGASFGSADPDTDVDVNEGLGASEKADFKGSHTFRRSWRCHFREGEGSGCPPLFGSPVSCSALAPTKTSRIQEKAVVRTAEQRLGG